MYGAVGRLQITEGGGIVMDCKHAQQFIHIYLDNELDHGKEILLNQHLLHCQKCKNHFHELQQTIAFVQSTSHIHTPADFTDQVINALPKEQFTRKWKRRMHNHPLLAATSLFFLLMMARVFN
jgi:anti-sigma factor RsiW